MPTVSKSIVDRSVRNTVVEELALEEQENYTRISNQSFYTIKTDENGNDRLVEVRIIVGNVSEDVSAQDKLNALIAKKQEQEEKARLAAIAKEEKAKKDAEKREQKRQKKEAEKSAGEGE